MLPNIIMRKYFSVTAIVLLFTITLKAQMPQLTVDGKTNNGVQLQALKIEVKVCGTVARTTWQMTFKNTTSRILEGTLNFPLKDGLSVSRYAIDINGNLREAVPVDRSKGTEVFETIERRRVDPGLLEKVDGNTFRTRIYPINANSTRTVLIGYEEELPFTATSLHYYLPLNLKDTVAKFSIDVSVIQSATRPVFDSSLNENIQFTNRNNLYIASVNKNNYVPGYSLSFSIPKPMDAAEVMLQEFENKYYYLVNTTLQKNEREKKLPSSVGLLWDASLSGSNRNVKKEIELLDGYFKKLDNAAVNLIVFSNTIKLSKQFTIQNGNWDELKKELETLQYDGATNLGNLNLKNIKTDEFILISDGHQTLGNKEIQLGNIPVYCINSSASADYSNLKFIAGKTAGQVIDLQTTAVEEALKKLINEPFRFLGIKQNSFVKENYPSIPVAVNGNFSAAGIATEGVEEIVLQFGYGNTVSYEKTVTINTETQLCEKFDITKVFAQKKIAELDIQYSKNKQEIERVGKQFGVVTRNTSLIVLETVNDYIQYQVEPPAELREAYDMIMKQRQSEVITKKETDLRNSLDMMATLKEWYNQKTEEKEKVEKKPVAVPRPVPVQTQRVQPQQTNNVTATPTGSNKQISGRVTDINGNPVPFATIKVRGSSSGFAADANGIYSIRAKEGDVLQISAAGNEVQALKVRGNENVINVGLRPAQQLSEVVVTALGVKRNSRQLGYSTSTVSTDELNEFMIDNVATGLAAKVSGLDINMANNNANPDTRITLRGNRSILGNNGALLVVDDIQLPLSYMSSLNPNDVDNVTVLKDAAATGLYGSEAANGVIIVTTKKFQQDSVYRKQQQKIAAENKTAVAATPPFNPETFDYIREIKQTEKANRYLKYLELSQYYAGRPTYYFEVASYLLKTGDKINGITVLTNLAELENGSYELYKMLGYKLKEAGDYEGELSAFKKVLELRPADPQSYRDCALAYADGGDYQQALDMLYAGMTKSYSSEMTRMYNGIEEIFLIEINRIIAAHKNELDIKKIDKKLIVPMPADIRVVMNWNKNNSDIDLWVTDPNGEKCFYSHKTTEIGGRISDDFTEGFGPEQFILKSGIKGKYKIQINYYSDRQVTIAGPTTVMAEIYLHYGTAKEEKKIITLQMEKGKQGAVFIGEVEL